MSDKAKLFLTERGISTNEMVEGAYGSAYYLEGMLDSFKDQCVKENQELFGDVYEVINLKNRIKELEEGMRECGEVFDQLEEMSMVKYCDKLLNEMKDEKGRIR